MKKFTELKVTLTATTRPITMGSTRVLPTLSFPQTYRRIFPDKVPRLYVPWHPFGQSLVNTFVVKTGRLTRLTGLTSSRSTCRARPEAPPVHVLASVETGKGGFSWSGVFCLLVITTVIVTVTTASTESGFTSVGVVAPTGRVPHTFMK